MYLKTCVDGFFCAKGRYRTGGVNQSDHGYIAAIPIHVWVYLIVIIITVRIGSDFDIPCVHY
jgi:hypothetical protein